MVELKIVDSREIYYMVKSLYKCTGETYRKTENIDEQMVEYNQNRADSDLKEFIKEIKTILSHLPMCWYETYARYKGCDYKCLALHFIKDCSPA
ncbi:hypothetical protein ACF91D_30240 [Staphylococcus sp. 231237_7MaSpsaltlick]|uniref:hypothetical protein n=1 Tax=Staphylococcus TaxID=1279 RepID=UPI00370B576E